MKRRREFNPPAALDNIAGGYLGEQARLFGDAKAVFRGDTGSQTHLFLPPEPAAAMVRPEQAYFQEGNEEQS